jgi:hypothetical protein
MANPLINSTKVIIPVNVAIAKTTNWRNFMSRSFPEADVKALPKAVYISRNDIIDLAKDCEADESMLGVRAYFTLKNAYEEGVENEVKFIMVLVKDTPGYFNGQDILYIPHVGGTEASLPGGDEPDDSNVYDFTKPCPDCCDPSSPLFSNDPPPPVKKGI